MCAYYAIGGKAFVTTKALIVVHEHAVPVVSWIIGVEGFEGQYGTLKHIVTIHNVEDVVGLCDVAIADLGLHKSRKLSGGYLFPLQFPTINENSYGSPDVDRVVSRIRGMNARSYSLFLCRTMEHLNYKNTQGNVGAYVSECERLGINVLDA